MITLERSYLPFGTYGRWSQEEDIHKASECFTVERPWLDNKPSVSCIPEGTYKIFRSTYHRGGYPCFEVSDVKGRSLIKIHIANWPKDVHGCIGMGNKITPLNLEGKPVLAVSSSRYTFNEWMETMEDIDATPLRIVTYSPLNHIFDEIDETV